MGNNMGSVLLIFIFLVRGRGGEYPWKAISGIPGCVSFQAYLFLYLLSSVCQSLSPIFLQFFVFTSLFLPELVVVNFGRH